MADFGRHFAWDSIPSAQSYEIELLDEAGTATLFQKETRDSLIEVSELFSGRNPGNYNVRVRPKNGARAGAWSALFPVTLPGLTPPVNFRFK